MFIYKADMQRDRKLLKQMGNDLLNRKDHSLRWLQLFVGSWLAGRVGMAAGTAE